MKSLFLFSLLCAGFFVKAQSPLNVSTFNGDTIVGTGYYTLSSDTIPGKSKTTDDVVGVRIISKKKSKYWLYFYFTPNDIPAATVSISGKRYAYIRTAQDKYYRISYSGNAYTYSTGERAGFFIDITQYASQLKNEVITDVRLETSVLYHAIELKDDNQNTIAHLINALLSY